MTELRDYSSTRRHSKSDNAPNDFLGSVKFSNLICYDAFMLFLDDAGETPRAEVGQ